jgi:protein-tyrosine phosphatase
MAEAIARASIAARGITGVEVASAGTSAWDGSPASDGALLVSLEHGLALETHRARVLSREIIDAADLVLTMGPHHAERANALGGDKTTHLLMQFASQGKDATPVADPFGGDLDAYRTTFAELETAVEKVLDRLVAEQGAKGS